MNDYQQAAYQELARRELERRRQQQAVELPKDSGITGFLGSTIKKGVSAPFKALGSFTEAVDETPIPLLPAVKKIAKGDIKEALWFDASKSDEGVPKLGDPKKYVSKEIKENVPGLPGRVLAGASEALLDPTNLMAIGLARKASVAAEGLQGATKLTRGERASRIALDLLGRGDMTKANYLKMLAGSGAGASVGGEVGGTPGAILGGLGGGWASLANMSRIRGAKEAAQLKDAQILESSRNLDGMSEGQKAGIKKAFDRYKNIKADDGQTYKVITQEGLLEQIGGVDAELYQLKKRQEFSPNASLQTQIEEIEGTSAALKEFLGFLRDSGNSGIPAVDEVDAGRRLAKRTAAYDLESRRLLDSAQAEGVYNDLETAMSKLPDFRFVEEDRGSLANVFKRQMREAPASAEGLIAETRNLDEQVRLNRDARKTASEQVRMDKAAQKQRFDEVLSQFPLGSRQAARNYLSSLITGSDPEGAFGNLVRKFPAARDMRPELEQVFGEVTNLHRVSSQSETTLNDLLRSGKGLEETARSTRRLMDDQLSSEFGSVTNRLKDRVVQIPGQAGRYRVTRMAIQNGKPALVLDYIKPGKKVTDILEEGAVLRAEEDVAYKTQLEEVRSLKAQQAELRRSGDEAGASELVSKIRASEDQAKRLREPARPVSAKELPKSESRLIVPLDDAREFVVYKPGKTGTPAALARAGYKDARTVTLLNEESALRVKGQDIQRNLENLKLERERVGSKLDQRDIQLAAAGMGSPETIEQASRLKQLDEMISRFETEQGLNEAENAKIQNSILGSQQALEASVVAAKEEADNLKRLYDEAVAERVAADEEIRTLFNMKPEDATFRYLTEQERLNQYNIDFLKDKLGNKRLSQAAYDQEVANLDAYADREVSFLNKPAQEALGGFSSSVDRNIHGVGSRNAVKRLIVTPFTDGGTRWIDPDAQRSGPLGWIRRVVMGTGARSGNAEGIMAGLGNGQQAAGQMADIDVGGMKRGATRLADMHLQKMAGTTEPELNPANFSMPPSEAAMKRSQAAAAKGAWARSVLDIQDAGERTQAYLKGASKSIDSREWQAELAGVPEGVEKQAIYDLLSGSFETASRNPNLFSYSDLDPTFANIVRKYGKQAGEVREMSGIKGVVRNLLKSEYRNYVPTGRIQNADGSITELKAAQRNMATDLYEIMRNAAMDPKRATSASITGVTTLPPKLEDMLIPVKDWEVVTAANNYNKIATDAAWKQVEKQLKDPKAVEVLKQGRDLQPNEFKDALFAEDWPKLKGLMIPEVAGGWTKNIEQVAAGMQKMAASTLVGDGSFSTVQGLIHAAVAPAATAKMLRDYWRYAKTDEGFALWLGDSRNYNDVVDLANRGLGIGRASLTGSSDASNLFQSVPGLKRVGNTMAAMDKIAFDRMQLMNKVNMVRTLEKDIQLLRAFGPETSDKFIDGIPTLKKLQETTDLYQSTPDQVRNAIVRQVNNTLGGLSKSQSLLGRDRQAVESALLFVPGFFRARGGLINSVSKVITNPNSAEGYLAASILAREVAFRLSFAASIAAATGTLDEFKKESDSWAALDPRRSGGMLSGPLGDGGGYMGLSWGNQAPKLYAQMLFGLREGDVNLNPKDRLEAAKAFFDGRTNPVIGTIIEQVEGKDFLGRDLGGLTDRDRLTNMLGAVAPMFVANTAEITNDAIHEGDINPLALAAQTGAEFMGLNVRPSVPYDVLENRFQKWQETTFPGEQTTTWKKAPSEYKRLARQDAGIQDAESRWTDDMARRMSTTPERDIVYSQWETRNAQYDNEIARMSNELSLNQLSPEEFRQRYSAIQDKRSSTAEEMRLLLAKSGVAEKDQVATLAGKGSALAQLMAEYSAVKPEPINKSQFTDAGIVTDEDIDWTRYKQDQQEVLSKYPPEVVAQFENSREPEDVNVKRLQDARKVLDTYFDEMPKYTGLSNIDGKAVDGYKASLNSVAQNLRDQGIQIDSERAYLLALQQMEKSGQITNPKQAQLAVLAMKMALDSSLSLKMRNLGGLQYLIENQEVFQWYPWLESEIPQKLRPLVKAPQQSTQDIMSRELRGANLSEVR